MSSIGGTKRKPDGDATDQPSASKRSREAVDPPAPMARTKSTPAPVAVAAAAEEAAAVAPPATPVTAPPPDIDDKEEVLKMLSDNETTLILDVRQPDEIVTDGFIKLPAESKNKWLQVGCTREDSPLLKATASNLIPDKSTPIITHCKSGARAGKAKEILISLGYETILNAGGFKDLGYLQEALDKSGKEST